MLSSSNSKIIFCMVVIYIITMQNIFSQLDTIVVQKDYPHRLDNAIPCCWVCHCENDIAHIWVEKNGIKLTDTLFNWEVSLPSTNEDSAYIIYGKNELYIDIGTKGQDCDSTTNGRIGFIGIVPPTIPNTIVFAVGISVLACIPVVNILEHDSVFCSNQTIFIKQKSKSRPTHFEWHLSFEDQPYNLYSNDTNFLASDLHVGKYKLMLIVKNEKGGDTAYTNFELIQAPIEIATQIQDIDNKNDFIILEACNETDKYSWYPSNELSCNDCKTTRLNNIVEDKILYCITSNNNGCEDTCTYIIYTPFDIFIPNTFTPNRDGENDIFLIRGKNIKVDNIIIYNRWGNEIYNGNLENGWDGTYKNKLVDIGIYSYILSYINIKSNSKISKTGLINIIY